MQVKKDAFTCRSDCSIACALDLIGDKWSLLIIRDALRGSKAFGEFSASEEKIASNILSNRLDKLVKHGFFVKVRNAENRLKIDYLLTDRGRQIAPVLMALGKWGFEHIEGVYDVTELNGCLLENG